MPVCDNDPKRTYTGKEQCPTGSGHSARVEAVGTVRKGTDGRPWVVHTYKHKRRRLKRWVRSPDVRAKAIEAGQGEEPRIYVYGASWCKFCARAKALVRDSGLASTYVDIKDRAAAPAKAVRLAHRDPLAHVPTIPAVFVGDRYLGGSDKLAAYLTAM
jgi:glutaredoxin 3